MTQEFDDITLSSYVDGELDPESMQEVEAFLEQDDDARKYVVNAIGTTARLRESMNKVLYEEVPAHLINAILPQQKRQGRLSTALHPMFRLAAAIILILFGFGAGWLVPTIGDQPSFVMPVPFPASYNQVVQEAMEHNLSGAPRQWQSPENQAVIIVTPVKTYRDKNGQYFREFRMEVSTPTERRQVNGLAYRQKGEWKTKAVYFQ
jgi:anti-sigma factor RsiW